MISLKAVLPTFTPSQSRS